MPASTHNLTFNGCMMQRGFWLYVWRITTAEGKELLYVGRTGDSSSPHASSPIQRMGTHFAKNSKANTMLSLLEGKGVAPETSRFEMVSRGPLLPEGKSEDHGKQRDKVAALEKALAEALQCGGYTVLNTVNSKKHLTPSLWQEVSEAFAEHFAHLCRASEHKVCRSQKEAYPMTTTEPTPSEAIPRKTMAQFTAAHVRLLKAAPNLVKDYPDQWIAFADDGAVLSGKTSQELIERIKQAGMRPGDTPIKFLNTQVNGWIL